MRWGKGRKGHSLFLIFIFFKESILFGTKDLYLSRVALLHSQITSIIVYNSSIISEL